MYTCNYETVQNYKGDFTRKVFSLCFGCGICSDLVVYTLLLTVLLVFVSFYFTDSSDTEFKSDILVNQVGL